MPTDLLRRQDDLGAAMAQADGAHAATPLSCANGCNAPLQPIDTVAFFYRCGACEGLVIDPQRFAPLEDTARSAANRALFELVNLEATLKRATFQLTGTIKIDDVLPLVRQVIRTLKDDSLDAFGEAVHATAIAAAARTCALRADSLYRDSKNPVAGLEASKCAFAIQRLSRRSSLADRPELFTDNPLAPEPAHA